MEKRFKLSLALSIIISALVACGAVIFEAKGGLLLKGITSFGFVIVGLIGLLFAIKTNNNKKFAAIMFVGLFVCMVADVVLNLDFIIGALFFAVGHVFYFVAYCVLNKLDKQDAIICSIFAAISASIVMFVPAFDFGGFILEILCALYAIIISFMCGKAISNFVKQKSLANLIIVVGCLLFFFSDLMLLFYNFATPARIFDILCIYSYYPAQCLLGTSLLLKAKK